MVPRIARAGTSFKGAGLYYLHDKGALTAERVGWTQTLNMATDDPDRAIRHMAGTAMNANFLKQQAGEKLTGRKLKNPVYTYSLAWHEQDKPTKAEMMKAAHDSLERLGMDGNQVLIVQHTDTAHPHIHLIVNRVSHENGRVASTSNDRVKLSKWAQEHDTAHNRDHCPARRENNFKRSHGHYTRYTKDDYRLFNRTRAVIAQKQHSAARARLKEDQQPQLDAAFAHMKQAKGVRIAEIKERFRPQWASLYRQQKEQKKDFARLTRSLMGRTRIVLDPRLRDRLGLQKRDVLRPRKIMKALDSYHQIARKEQKAIVDHAFKIELEPFDREYGTTKDRLYEERASQRNLHFKDVQRIWKEAREPEQVQALRDAVHAAKTKKVSMRQQLIDSFGLEAVLEAERKEHEKAKQREKDKSNQNDLGRTRDR